MNAHLKMTSQKIADCFGFMRAQVIADDVNGPLWSLEGAQMYLGGMRVLRFLSNPVQIGGGDVNVQPACTLCHFETHEQPPIARVEFRFALDEHLEVGPVVGIVENVR
jgi:hypothetical protein